MKYYPNLHFWLLIPFAVTLAGFWRYWATFTEAPLHWHMHGLSATAWYLVLILQPWLYHNRPISVHRKVGTLSLLLAGFVVASAINVIKGNLLIPAGPLYAVRYSLSLLDLILISGFTLSVVMAVLKSRDTGVHAHWMIATVFWVLTPATTRLSFVPLGAIFKPEKFEDFPFEWQDVLVWNILLVAGIVAILMIRDYVKEKRVYNAYLLVFIAQIVCIPVVLGLKDAKWLRSLFDTIFLTAT